MTSRLLILLPPTSYLLLSAHATPTELPSEPLTLVCLAYPHRTRFPLPARQLRSLGRSQADAHRWIRASPPAGANCWLAHCAELAANWPGVRCAAPRARRRGVSHARASEVALPGAVRSMGVVSQAQGGVVSWATRRCEQRGPWWGANRSELDLTVSFRPLSAQLALPANCLPNY